MTAVAGLVHRGRVHLGALHASTGWDSPRERLRTALTAAERFHAAVRGPFAYASTRSSR